MSAEHLDKLVRAAQNILEFAFAMGAARPASKLTFKELLAEFQVAKARWASLRAIFGRCA